MVTVSSSANEAHMLEKSLFLLNGSSQQISAIMTPKIPMDGENANKNCRISSPGLVSESVASVSQLRSDDELTSLTWLQDSNLLFGTALSQMKGIVSSERNVSAILNGVKPVNSKMEEVKPKLVEVATSPEIEFTNSDFAEEQEPQDVIEKPKEIIETHQAANLDQDPVPYNPQIHVKSKPPYSFSSLIFMAIEDSNEKALPVKDIYSWVIRHFPYYRGAPTGWKNSVRHNLSLNKCFRKVDKSPTLGKGSLWMVDPAYRPNLLQTLNKTPFPTTTRTDHIYVTNVRSAMNRNPLDHLNRLKEGTALYPEERIEVPAPLPDKKVTENSHSVIEVNGEISPTTIFHQYPTETYFNMEFQERPMLLKQVHKDDVDAAAAMLVLKHGPMILQEHPQFSIKNVDSPVTGVTNGYKNSRKRKQFHTELHDPNTDMDSPNLDHSYVGANDDSIKDIENDVKKQKTLLIYNSELPLVINERVKDEENDKRHVPFYEANALLKLASIATSLASTDMHQNMSYFNSSVKETLPSKIVNEMTFNGASQSSYVNSNSPLKNTNRKKKNLHPVKRILNNEIKKLSNNNSSNILNKNDTSRLDHSR